MDPTSLSPHDQAEIEAHGISEKAALEQIEILARGYQPVKLLEALTPKNGLHQLTDAKKAVYCKHFESHGASAQPMMVIPASGAGSRMFHLLTQVRQFLMASKKTELDWTQLSKQDAKVGKSFKIWCQSLPHFAFYPHLLKALKKQGLELLDLTREQQWLPVLNCLLDKDGLNFLDCPKALIPFHTVEGSARTPLEEHLRECQNYLSFGKQSLKIHLTAQEAYIPEIQKVFQTINQILQKEGDLPPLELTCSTQNPATDTIAIDGKGQLFRNADGKLLFRPGGHGALLENLNRLPAAMIFLKNIDNVSRSDRPSENARYQKILGGYCLAMKDWIHRWCLLLAEDSASKDDFAKMQSLLERIYRLPEGTLPEPVEEKSRFFMDLLNRPIRVVGVVPNQGEPGGAPFYIHKAYRCISAQIVESSQTDADSASQQELFGTSTHFNPVNLVLWKKDYLGRNFDLTSYRDPQTAFVTEKFHEGRSLTALEHPGLWNGAMAYWLSFYVEVPVSTFHPVKTVLDLLRKDHRNEP